MELSLKTHICAYLDVLGGTRLFQCVDLNATEAFIDMVLDLERRLNNMRSDGVPVVRTFTDNVFAAFPLVESKKLSIEDQVGYFLTEVSGQLEQIFLLCKLPIRGAISVGKLHIDNRIVVGDPVVRTVELEKKANFPRVVLDDSVLALLPKRPLARETLVYEAEDGVSSLNYLGLKFWMMRVHQEVIDRRINEFEGDERTQEKYRWLLQYQKDIEKRISSLGLLPQ